MHTPLGIQILSISCSFWMITHVLDVECFGKIVRSRLPPLPPEGSRPHMGEILDPALQI